MEAKKLKQKSQIQYNANLMKPNSEGSWVVRLLSMVLWSSQRFPDHSSDSPFPGASVQLGMLQCQGRLSTSNSLCWRLLRGDISWFLGSQTRKGEEYFRQRDEHVRTLRKGIWTAGLGKWIIDRLEQWWSWSWWDRLVFNAELGLQEAGRGKHLEEFK